MSNRLTCSVCGEDYDGDRPAGHTCHGSADDELSELRNRVDDLEDEVAAIKAFLVLP